MSFSDLERLRMQGRISSLCIENYNLKTTIAKQRKEFQEMCHSVMPAHIKLALKHYEISAGIECPVCLEKLTDDSYTILLVCMHRLCKICTYNLISLKKHDAKCPVCREQMPIQQLYV